MEVSVSFLKSKYPIDKQIEVLNASNCDLIHVDFMDGTFTENTSLSLEEMHLDKFTKPIEIHLMVARPEDYIEYCRMFNPKHFIVHYEVLKNPIDTIIKITDNNMLPGLAINPETDIEAIKPLLKYVDMVLIMSVIPGKGGQNFIINTIDKLKILRKVYKGRIEVDGGINDETISLVKEYVDSVVSGSYVCLSDDCNEKIAKLKR